MHVLRILLVDHVTASKRGPGLCMYCVYYCWTMLQPVREDQDCACTAYITGGPCVTASKRGPGLCMYCVCYWWTMLQPVREDQDCACTAYVTGGPCYSQ